MPTIQTATDPVLFNCNLQSSPTIPQRFEFLDCNKTHASARRSISASCGFGLVSLLFPADAHTRTQTHTNTQKNTLRNTVYSSNSIQTKSKRLHPILSLHLNIIAVLSLTQPNWTHILSPLICIKSSGFYSMFQLTKLPEIFYSNFGP